MDKAEQLKLVTPEYGQIIDELGSLVSSLPGRFPDDIEYSRSSFRLPLRSADMPPNTYYCVTKSLPYPYAAEPDWDAIPAQLSWVDDCGSKTHGYEKHFRLREGILTSEISEYDNNEYLDDEWPSITEVPMEDIRKIINELSDAKPFHPEAIEQEKIGKIARAGLFIKRVLFRK